MRNFADRAIEPELPLEGQTKDVLGLVTCYDDKNCEIKAGRAAEVAQNFDVIVPILLPEQRLIVVEELLAQELLSEERALEFARRLGDEDKMTLLKYI